MRPRISIAALLFFVAYCGICFAAMKHPTDLWAVPPSPSP
jgi:hypothetical protein